MSIKNQYNLKSPGVKRLMREACELAEPTEEYHACPLEDNLFEWHFTVRGPPNTEFEGGFYHGRILLPSQYPMQPPNIILLTPNGRFEVNKKICLSISGHHPESWQPSWSIRTALLALIAFMPTPAAGTIGSLDYTPEERQILAKKSKNWECQVCGKISTKLLETSAGLGHTLSHEESSLLQQISLKAEEETKKAQIETVETENDNVSEVITAVHVRQRVTTENTAEVHNTTTTTSDVLLEESVNRSSKDQMWTAAIWVIVSLITLLIIRRVFFI